MSKEEKKRIAWLSDSPFFNTGFSTQSFNILNGLSDEYETYYFANHYQGQRLPPGIKLTDGTEFKFHIWGSGKQPYMRDVIEPYLRKIKPKIFGVLLDTFMLMQSNWLSVDMAPTKEQIFYFPSDGGGHLPLGCEQILMKFSCPVAMSKFAQKQAWDIHRLKTEYIPHGVDTEIYKPLSEEEKKEIRQKWRLQGKFVVGSVYRNQGRKMADRIFKTFKLFCKDKPDAVLLLHTDPDDIAQVFNTHALIQRLNLQNRVRFTGMRYYQGFTYKQMNEVYNLMDVFFLTTTGEGFGIPTIEAMQCKVPVVITDYTTSKELVIDDGKCGEVVKLVGCKENYVDMADSMNMKDIDFKLMNGTLVGSWNVDRAIFDIDDGVEKLNKLYYDEKLRERYGEVGNEKVKKFYSWDVVIPQWRRLVKRLIE